MEPTANTSLAVVPYVESTPLVSSTFDRNAMVSFTFEIANLENLKGRIATACVDAERTYQACSPTTPQKGALVLYDHEVDRLSEDYWELIIRINSLMKKIPKTLKKATHLLNEEIRVLFMELGNKLNLIDNYANTTGNSGIIRKVADYVNYSFSRGNVIKRVLPIPQETKM